MLGGALGVPGSAPAARRGWGEAGGVTVTWWDLPQGGGFVAAVRHQGSFIFLVAFSLVQALFTEIKSLLFIFLIKINIHLFICSDLRL